MRILWTKLRAHKVPCKSRDYISGTQNFRCLVSRVLLKPAYPEDLNLLSPIFASNLFCAFVVDGDCENVGKSVVSIGVGGIVSRRNNHDIRLCVKVDDI